MSKEQFGTEIPGYFQRACVMVLEAFYNARRPLTQEQVDDLAFAGIADEGSLRRALSELVITKYLEEFFDDGRAAYLITEKGRTIPEERRFGDRAKSKSG